MTGYVVGFWCGVGCAVVLYVLYRLARELWFDLEIDIMAHEVRAEMRRNDE